MLYNLIFKVLNFFTIKPKNPLTVKKIQSLIEKEHHFCFDCTRCGKCCYGPGNVYFSKKELENIKKYLKFKDTDWKIFQSKIIHKEKNGLYIHKTHNKCIFLNDKNQCQIYPVRPLQCRTFPFWYSHFENQKYLLELTRQCPGSNILPKNQINKHTIFYPEEIIFRCHYTIKKFNRNQKTKEHYINL